jgi:hypothetical protein
MVQKRCHRHGTQDLPGGVAGSQHGDGAGRVGCDHRALNQAHSAADGAAADMCPVRARCVDATIELLSATRHRLTGSQGSK